jgi:2-polyprenyl-3-methyl-5-hydroxy-6-metoxy-1,4-benzoquinol methylase
LANIYFEQRDLTHYQPERQFDFITAFDAIHDQARPDNVLSGIYHALEEDGDFLMVDINSSSLVENNMEHPIGPLLYTVSTMHCMTVSLAQKGLGLGAIWGREKANEMLKKAGFSEVREHLLPQDFQNRYYVVRK